MWKMAKKDWGIYIEKSNVKILLIIVFLNGDTLTIKGSKDTKDFEAALF